MGTADSVQRDLSSENLRMRWRWRWLLLLPALSFTFTAWSIARGDYDGVGFPAAMMPMHAVANGLEAIGWLAVFLLASARVSGVAARVTYVLCGAFGFDLLTTWPLTMPIPPGFAIWGSAALALGLLAARVLEQTNAQGRTR